MTHDVEGETQVLMELSSDLTWSLTKQRRRVKTQKRLHKTLLPKITYLLTPWSRVLPEKLKRPELLKKFPAFYGT
jgi:hypothetical protein